MYGLILQTVFIALIFTVSCHAAIPLFQGKIVEHHNSREYGAAGLNRFKQNTKFKHIESAKLLYRPDLVKGKRVHAETMHRVVIVRKQNNMKKLESILLDVSNPASTNYGSHMSKDTIAALTANPSAAESIKDFLRTHNIHDWNATRYDDYISAVGPVSLWERLFDTQFFEFEHTLLPGKKFIRCLKYSLPEHLTDHIEGVLNTVQFPDHHVGKRLHLERHTGKELQATATVTPALLNQVYNIANNTGNHHTSQAVYAILDQTFSPSDLTIFQNMFDLPQESIAANVGGHVSNDACANNIDNCIEANLDVQYMMAVAQNVPTTYYYWTGSDVWLDWIESVADLVNPPDVFSISYGSYEAAFSLTYLQAFNSEAIKLGVAGTTVLVASGDDGVAGFLVKAGRLSCDYYASFPASSPYVTAVGGTMGPESGTAEITCQSTQGSSITTGGGFSHVYTLPSWQASEVDSYFARVAGTSKAPRAGYDSTKRGYPDISALANRYQVVANGITYIVSGTSASSPVVAGMVSLVNSARRAAGNSTLGWLNPALYALYPTFVKDVTSGDNKCLSSGAGCCTQGFYATSGWDPVTGLGSINFGQFLRTFVTLRAAQLPAHSPTVSLDDKAWFVMDGYEVTGCPSKKQPVVAQSGYMANQCFVRYDNSTSRPVSSMRYTCDADLGYATAWYFSDLECNIDSFVNFEQQPLGCMDVAAGSSIVRSINLHCTSKSGTDLPLPAGKHMAERAYNHPSLCLLNSTAYFNSWRTEHCFAVGDASSFMMTEDGREKTFNDSQCSNSGLVQAVMLSTGCEAATGDEVAEPVTGLRVTYVVYDVPDDGKYNGLSAGEIAAIVIGVFVALVGLCCCCACAFALCCRSRSPRTSIGPATQVHMHTPMVPTVAAVAVPVYEAHHLATTTSYDGNYAASTSNNYSDNIKYQPVPV